MSQRAEVLVINGLCWSTGAPEPVIVGSEQRTMLAFYELEDDRDAATVVCAEFVRCTAIKHGFPNEEVLSGHPLWGHGLDFYQIHEVHESEWLADLRKIEAVHPRAPAVPFRDDRHFVLTFHDSTVEAIAEDLVFAGRYSSMDDALRALVASVRSA